MNSIRNQGNVILTKKGINNGKYNGLEIDNMINSYESSENIDLYLRDVFNTHERFITYDNETFHSVQAALCGCISIVIPDGRLSESEWRRANPMRKWGIAYGDTEEQIEFAKSTVDNLRNEIESLIRVGESQIDNMRKLASLKFPDENHITCIVYTKWENLFFIEQLERLKLDENITQIIILDRVPDRRPKSIDVEYFEIVETDLNKIPAYEIAVENSYNNILMFISDDIKFASKEITGQVLINKHALGILTPSTISFLHDSNNFGFYNEEESYKKSNYPDKLMEKMFFMKKKNWIVTPGILEFGLKEWVKKCNKPLNYFVTKNKIELSGFDPLIDEINNRDMEIIKRIQ